MIRVRTFLVGVLVALGAAAPAFAQTTLNSTTTTAAVTATQQVIPLTSVTNISTGSRAGLGDLIFFDREAAQVNAIDTTALTVTVRRGAVGTLAAAHASGVVVWTGPQQRFYYNQVVGSCTATAEQYLPHIVLPGANSMLGGDIYDCKNSEWVQLRENGFRVWNPGRSDGGTTYTSIAVSAAITIQPGISFINGTTLAMTLANPTVEQNGMVMIIMATNASAHTVTYTAGFDGGTTARDVATFGGAVGDNMVIIAFNGVWWVMSTRNVTFG